MSIAQFIDTGKRYSVTNIRGALRLFEKQSDFEISSARAALGYVIALPSSRFDRKTILIQDLGDDRLSLINPLAVEVERWPNRVVTYSHDLNEFAFADEELDAVDQFKALVVDLYFLLKGDQDNLGPLPLKHWHFLRSIIREN